MILRTVIFVSLCISTCVAGAQSPETSAHEQRPRIAHTSYAKARIKVDGRLTEAVWNTIRPITHFIQTQPNEGAPASERTEALIFYDDQNIYFGFRCYDSEPEKIVARLGAHDGRTNSDSVDILIDTFHDRRTGYFFSINSRGIQYDAITNESGGQEGWAIHDASWDGIWHSAASLEPWGWSVEVVIPFKSIRISHAASQTWGLNLAREIVRKNEQDHWVAVSRYDETMKPSKAGMLEGLENVEVGRNIELVPFFTANYRRTNWQPELNGPSANAGLDARYGISQNLTAAITLNPDFGETEADEFTSEISRFEIFFPEKRKFFTEGANYFSTPMSLFFSRRIGAVLPNGEPQRVLEGGKITGKTGPWTLGLLQASTQETKYVDPVDGVLKTAPAATFGVVRVQHDIFTKSAIGFTSVNRFQGAGDVGQRENSHGVDLSILHGQHIFWSSQFMVNTNAANPGLDVQHTAWNSAFTYNSNLWEYNASVGFVGRSVDMSNTGYQPETDRWSGDLRMVWKPMINRWGMRQFFAELNYDESNGTRGELENAGADVRLQLELKNFWNVHFEHSYDRVRYNKFTPDLISLPSTRVYQTPKWRIMLETNENRRIVIGGHFYTGKLVQYAEHFYGFSKEFGLETSARISNHLRWDVTAIDVRESLGTRIHYQDRRYVISRFNYQFTPRLRTRILAQYEGNRHGRNVSINSLIAYDFTARSALFVGYNRQRHLPLDTSDLGHELFVKLSYLFSF